VHAGGYDFELNQATVGDSDLSGDAEGTPEFSLEVDGGRAITLQTIEWSENRPEGAPARLGAIRVTAAVSSVSPALLLAATTGRVYGQMELVSRRRFANGSRQEFARWTLEDVAVTSYGSAATAPRFDGPTLD